MLHVWTCGHPYRNIMWLTIIYYMGRFCVLRVSSSKRGGVRCVCGVRIFKMGFRPKIPKSLTDFVKGGGVPDAAVTTPV